MITTNLYQRAIDAYGSEHQIGIVIEELSELITALTRKHLRHRGTTDDVLSEIADAFIMLEQLKIIYGTEEIKKMMYIKLEKLTKHIERKEKENDA